MANELEALASAMETYIRHMNGASPDVAALDIASYADNALHLVAADREAIRHRSALLEATRALAEHLSSLLSLEIEKDKTIALREKALDAAAAFQNHMERLPPSTAARNLGLA